MLPSPDVEPPRRDSSQPKIGSPHLRLSSLVAAHRSDQLRKPSRTVLVGIVSDGLALWFPVARTLGDTAWIRQPPSVPEPVRRANEALGVPSESCVLQDDISLSEHVRRSGVGLVLFEQTERVPPRADDFWSAPSLIAAIAMKSGSRRPPLGWDRQDIHLRHEDYSGVTRIRSTFWVYFKEGSEPPARPQPTGVDATLATIIDPTTRSNNAVTVGYPVDDRPLGDPLQEARRQVSRPELNHGRFALHSVFVPQGHVIRKLSVEEKLSALDVPTPLVKAAAEEVRGLWLARLQTPYKSRVHILQRLLPTLGDLSLSEPPGKRRKDGPSIDPLRGAPKKTRQEPLTTDQVRRLKETLQEMLDDLKRDRGPAPDELARAEPSPVDGAPKEIVKNDDAEVPVHLWNDRVAKFLDHDPQDPVFIKSCDMLRARMLNRWFANVCRSYYAWIIRMRDADDVRADENIGIADDERTLRKARDAIFLADKATYWDWPSGSGVFFWRWPREYWEVLRDGMAPRWISEPNIRNVPQRLDGNPFVDHQVKEKLAKMLLKGHLVWGQVDGLMYFFAVPKGTDDIRMVFDGTKSGLNDCLFAPWFACPTVETTLRSVVAGTWMADDDYGEFFLNYWLHDELRPLCGIDLTKLMPELREATGRDKLWVHWARPPMGTRPAPYQACQQGLRAKRLILGDPDDPLNAFQWSDVVENYPGSPDYDPSLPWIFKVRGDGSVAADLQQYVDDLRENAPTRELAWQASARVAKIGGWLGVQIAPRKKRSPSQSPGPWQGAILGSTPFPFKTIDIKRWEKNKAWVQELLEQVRDTSTSLEGKPTVLLSRKKLQSVRSHLTYIGRVYRPIIPYLKGFHLSIESFRDDRDEEGWRLPLNARRACSGDLEEPFESSVPPVKVRAVPRFRSDLESLSELLKPEEPPKVPIRPRKEACVSFCFGDAAGAGFGFSASIRGLPELEYDFGLWAESFSKRSSSNLREALNLLLALKRLIRAGKIPQGAEVWVFTDNFVTERAFWKGNASSPELFEVVLELRKLEMEGHIFLHVVWVAGTRMIAQGTDGLSRGDFSTGIMLGDAMLHHVPINLTAFERSPALLEWVRSWASSLDAELLSPKDWFHRAHQDGNCIWDPAPVVADAALEQLCESRHTKPWRAHVFVCPALMTMMWRKQLSKVVDVLFNVPVGTNIWPSHMHEPVLVGIVFPLPDRQPWTLRRTKLMADAQSELSGLWAPDCAGKGSYLRQLCSKTDRFPVAQGWGEIENDEMWDQFEDDLDRFKEARDGDVWMSPFQCDTCHFVNIKKRGPDPATLGDKTLLDIIRRANLDAFWSRERSTVRANWLEGKRAAEILTDLGIEAPLGLHQRGPFPVEDTFGMVPAIAFLQRSLDPGRNAANVQFDTVRKLRTFYSNFYAATPPGALEANRPGSAGSEPLRGTPTNSPFFKRFLQGAHKRMGDLWIPDRALTIEQLLAAQDILEDEWTNLQGSVDQSRRYRVAATGCLITIGFSAALRGEELPKLDLEDIMRRWASATEHPTNPHCPIGLRGRFKGETGEKSHAMAVASTSASGVENGKWMERMLGFAVDGRIKSGPLFRRTTKDGKFQKARVSDLDSLFHEILKKVQRAHPNLIEPDADVSEEFSVGRSLRRGGTSQARNQKVPEDVINTNNRWRNKENAKAKASKGSLLETYTDVLANLPLRLRFSQVL